MIVIASKQKCKGNTIPVMSNRTLSGHVLSNEMGEDRCFQKTEELTYLQKRTEWVGRSLPQRYGVTRSPSRLVSETVLVSERKLFPCCKATGVLPGSGWVIDPIWKANAPVESTSSQQKKRQ